MFSIIHRFTEIGKCTLGLPGLRVSFFSNEIHIRRDRAVSIEHTEDFLRALVYKEVNVRVDWVYIFILAVRMYGMVIIASIPSARTRSQIPTCQLAHNANRLIM